ARLSDQALVLAAAVSAVTPARAPEPPASAARIPEGARLSPSVRRIVTEEKLDPTKIQGSGREGRVLKADALDAAASRKPVAVDATPLARKLAEAAGVDLSTRGNAGPGNRIRKADLVRPREIEPIRPSPSQEEVAARVLV